MEVTAGEHFDLFSIDGFKETKTIPKPETPDLSAASALGALWRDYLPYIVFSALLVSGIGGYVLGSRTHPGSATRFKNENLVNPEPKALGVEK